MSATWPSARSGSRSPPPSACSPTWSSHLLLAGRELFLAAKAVMDARAEDLGRDAEPEGRARMERIDIG